MQYKYVLGYLRLSDDDEDKMDESNSIKNQRMLIEYFVSQNEEFHDSELIFFADDGFTGTNYNRPDFKRMMELVKKEHPCCIIVKDDCVIKARTPQTLENRHFLRIGTEFRAIQRPQRAAYHIETS